MNVRSCDAFSRAEAASGIRILDHGLAQLDGEWNHRHVRPSYSRLYYILSGGGFVETERETVALCAGRTYFIPAGLTLRYGCPDAMRQLYFHVSVHAPDGYDLFGRLDRILESDDSPGALEADYASGQLLRETLARCRVEADVARFAIRAGLDRALSENRSAFLDSVFACISENLRASLTIAEVARRLSMSESALAKRFRREFGAPLGRYIDEMVLQDVIRRLSATEESVGAIAEAMGFCDPFYLSRFFSERVGMSPSAYRAHQRGQI